MTDLGPEDYVGNSEQNFSIDFTNVETRSFDPLPTGKYLVVATDYEVAEVQSGDNAGKPKIVFEFTIQEPEQVGKQKAAGRKTWVNFFPTIEKTLWNIKGFLAALNPDNELEGQTNFNPAQIMAGSVDERTLVAKIKSTPERKDPKTGQTYNARNEIQQFYPASDWTESAPKQGATSGSILP